MAFGGDGLRFNDYLSDLWIRRYDGKDIWPPNLEALDEVPEVPSTIKPPERVTLKTGEQCRYDGRYWLPALGYKFDNEEDGPLEQIVLLPGDVAPYRLALGLGLGPNGELLGREAVVWELRGEL